MNNRQNNNSANMLNITDRTFNTQQPFVRIESVMDGISPNPLADNSTTESSIIFISGTTLPNETVFVFLNDGRQRIVRADGEGNWSATVTSWGRYGEAAIKVTLPFANVSDDFNLTLVEPVPETRPSIDKIIDDSHGWMDLIAPGSTTENATPLVSGFAPAGSLVIITVNGEPVGSVIADSDNRWEWSTPLQEGLNTIKVSTNGEESEPLELTYAPFVAPIEPELAILQINDSMGSEVQPGGAANSNDVMLRGTGPRYQILEIWAGDRFVGNAWTDENGNWQQYVTLPEGENSLSVSAGGMQSEVVAIITPVAPPPTPEIFSAWADENNLGPVFNGGMTSDATPRLEGRAGSHAVVEIWNNRRPVGSVIADQNGYWNYTPTLAEGRNQFVVISQGVSSSSFTMTYAPVVGPVEQELSITQISDTLTGTDIAPGGSANSSDVLISGTGPRHQMLKIWAGDVVVGNAWSDQNGNWQLYVTLPEGENNLTVRAGSMQSEAVMILTPIAPPPVPEIFSAWEDESNVGPVFNGGTTSDATPRLEGRAGYNAVVEIWINDELVETVVADRNGYWNYTPRLAEGVNQVFVVSQGISSQPFDMTYAPHVEPVDQELSITGISDMAGSDIGPGGSAISNDVVLSGTGPRYQVLEIWSGDRFVGNVWTDQNGTWYQYVTLPEGNNSLTVRAGDVQSEAVMILTPIAPPPVPEIFSAWEDESNVGSVFNGGTTSDATPRLEGRAGNNAVVEIWINEGRVETIMADQFGYWRYTPTLSEGANSITVVSQGVSSDVFNIDFAPVVIPLEPELTVYPLGSDGDVTYQRMANVFGKAPAGSMITLLINEQAVATIIVNDNGDWSFYTALFNGENRVSIAHGNDVSETTTVTLVGSPAPAISFAHDDEGVRTYVYHNAATDDATPQLQGTAAPNAIVQIYRGTQNIGSAAADINGNWIFDASINPGLNEISVVENGITSEVFNITLEVAPTITGLFADGDLIENGGASNGTSFVLQGTAQPYAQVAIDQTGSRTPLWTTADQFGNWSVPVVVNVNGTNSFYVISGGQNSEGYSFTYIPVAELPEDAEMLNYIPLIGIVHDSVGSLQWLQNNGWTDDAQPEIYGTYARPNSIVTIVDGNNNVIGSTTADNSGDWRFIPSEPLAPGKYDFYAQNEFGLSGNPFTLNLRDPEPAPLMFAWDDTGDLQGFRWSGELMDDTTPTFHGSTQPFSQISLFNGEGELLGTATSGWNGAWTIDIVEPLQSGRHSFVAVDEKGKSSDVFVLNIVPVNDAQLPEMSSLLADASMMVFAAQPSDDEQQEIVELNISEEDMAITTLDTGVIVESIGQDMLSAQQLEEEYNLNTL